MLRPGLNFVRIPRINRVSFVLWRTGRKRYILEANWLGRGTPWCKEFAGDHDDVHRIKVDEKRGIVITTHQDGGLNVRDMDTNEILWGLPRVRLFAASPI